MLRILLNVEGTRSFFRELTLVVCLLIAKSRCERGDLLSLHGTRMILECRLTFAARNDAMKKWELVFKKTSLYACNSQSFELRALTGN